MLDLRRSPGDLPWLVAHRGASALAPENTMAAFRRAVEDGADIIEFDVRLSADAQVVVIHDRHLCRTTDGRGFVARKRLAELRALDAGSWFDLRFAGEPIPTLDEVLAWAPVPLMIELKGGSRSLARGLVEKCVQLVIQHEKEVIFISFYLSFLRRIKRLVPAIATGTIVKQRWFDRLLIRLLRHLPSLKRSELVRRRLLRPLAISRALEADSLSIPASELTETLVKATHAAGMAVSPGGKRWDYGAVISMGADTISADDPAAVRTALSRPRAH